ncbi:MAG: hypothetical protein IJW70_06265 [Clostridia bacterium]|nr:hypothetical protein [Clostridia bacterium]
MVLGFETKFFHLDGNWAIDGRTIEQGSTFDWDLIRQSLIESSDDTITIPGTYRVAVKPETIQMSATYGDSTDPNVFLTLSLFIMVDPELITVDVEKPVNYQIKGGLVSDDLPGLYHYSLPLTAKQLENNDAFVIVYLSENGVQRYSNKIELAWLNYSNNIDFTQVSQVTGQLLNATMDYGKAIQAVCATSDTELDEQTQNRINTVLTQLISNPPKTITSEEYTVSESAFNSVVSFKNAYGVFNQTAANFGLAYSFALNLPENAELTRAGILLAEKGEVINGVFTLIDDDKQQKTNEALGANFGRYYAYDHKTLDPEGYRLVEIKNVPAAELSVKLVTVYVEYTLEGETYLEYSQSIEYGVMTYLNNTMATVVKGGTYDEKVKKDLYLYKSAFDIATNVIVVPESSN